METLTAARIIGFSCVFALALPLAARAGASASAGGGALPVPPPMPRRQIAPPAEGFPGETVELISSPPDLGHSIGTSDRFGGGTRCNVAGKHCESGDVLIHDVPLPAPKRGDIIATPMTGAYGHAMANTYNAQPRPPIVFVSGGEAREVVRRESYADLTGRDV